MKIISGSADARDGVASPSPKLTPQEKAARKAAIAASAAQYIKLICDHFTTLERDQAYGFWRPGKGVSFCENCGGWRKFKPKVKRVIIPPEPLF
jgi:hypothetical protein